MSEDVEDFRPVVYTSVSKVTRYCNHFICIYLNGYFGDKIPFFQLIILLAAHYFCFLVLKFIVNESVICYCLPIFFDITELKLTFIKF